MFSGEWNITGSCVLVYSQSQVRISNIMSSIRKCLLLFILTDIIKRYWCSRLIGRVLLTLREISTLIITPIALYGKALDSRLMCAQLYWFNRKRTTENKPISTVLRQQLNVLHQISVNGALFITQRLSVWDNYCVYQAEPCMVYMPIHLYFVLSA